MPTVQKSTYQRRVNRPKFIAAFISSGQILGEGREVVHLWRRL